MQFRLKILAIVVCASSALYGQSANHIVISEVYGGGGNSGSTWKNDFVELYNPTSAPVNITGWSVQYASASGVFGNFKTYLSGVIQPKAFFLIQESQGAGGTKDLPTPDASGVLAMASASGKIALASDTFTVVSPLGASVVDFIGYGAANSSEGSGPAPVLTNTTGAERKASDTSTAVSLAVGGAEEKAGNGWDKNDNANDFVSQSLINPQNSASGKEPTPAIQAGVGVAYFSPQIVRADSSMQITFVLKGVTGAVITGLRFPKHSLFGWSRCAFNVSSSGPGHPVVKQTSDSVSVADLSLSGNDSAQMQISGLSAPDTTVKIAFLVETAAESDSTALVAPLPALVVYGIPRPVAVVKTNDAQGVPLNLQKPVTVRGIVTVANEFWGPAYVQDVSGGLAVFDRTFENSVKIGDEVTLTGTVTQFNGLTELANVVLHAMHSSGNVVIPSIVTCSQIARDGSGGVEMYEGMLVQLNGITVRDAQGLAFSTWSVSQSGTNYWLYDSDSVQARIDGEVTSIAGTTAPSGKFDLVGVVGQYTSALPYAGGYQVMPRCSADIISKGPIITVSPKESSISAGGFEIGWETAKPGTSVVRYGKTRSYELGVVSSTVAASSHRLAVSGLSPAMVYHVLAFSVSEGDTSFANDRIVSTGSQGSTGAINVYFNKSVQPALARGEVAKGNSNLTSLLIQRINGAKKSIDCALYSFSGQVGQSIANALVQARQRGIDVRLIIERDNRTSAASTLQILTGAGIPWISDDLDAVNVGAGLHHNKFFLIDQRGGAPDQVWVWTGSWNLTDSGTNSDLQNAIEIQDQALAGAFAMEFNEMWGSDSAIANSSSSRFGARKTDNTPHIFMIDGTPVEVYFSPSDGTTGQITATLTKAKHSINFALLTFTRSDIASVLKLKKGSGLTVRGLLDNGTDAGSQFNFLVGGGVDVLLDVNQGFLHHKYAMVDAELNGAAQYVITGSHNWTGAAESSNNENTLILQSNRIANLYLQEFAARYKESGGKDNIVVNVERSAAELPLTVRLIGNYPNPFNPRTTVGFELPARIRVELRVIDLLGRSVATLAEGEYGPGEYRVQWDGSSCASGVYYCRLRAGTTLSVLPMILMK
jgi:phosphatidylserine/phosphatidylglycerophosphate/cardiolipin synthase-like enzyme